MSKPSGLSAKTSPAIRPLRALSPPQLQQQFDVALRAGDGVEGAHCIHELWMRNVLGFDVDAALNRLWRSAAASVPDWLPMRYIEWLPRVYEISAQFVAAGGRSHIYLVLLDYADRREGPFGIYVGMTHYAPSQRFDQHKAGIRAAGSVLKRGLELLTGPVLHLQFIRRVEAARIERQLAEALSAEGLLVQGGH